METLLLATAITISILLITAIPSPKIRAAVYSLPIPITVLLIGTGGHVNTTHLTGLIDVIVFMSIVYALTRKVEMPIVPAIALGICAYIILGLAFKHLVVVPFLTSYLILTAIWLIYMAMPVSIKAHHYKKIDSRMTPQDYLTRGSIVYGLSYVIITIKSLILGAAVTFPYNGTFTVYVMREQLPVLITEICRNFFAIANFFLVVWIMQPKIGLGRSLIVAWVVNVTILYAIVNFLPRKVKV